jgi:hypothetical protein
MGKGINGGRYMAKKVKPKQAADASVESPGLSGETEAPREEQQAGAVRGEGPKTPVHTIRIGRLWCRIWGNRHPDQGVWYSVRITRSYRDASGWKSSDSMGRDDLLPQAELCRLAFHWITQELQKNDRDRTNGG